MLIIDNGKRLRMELVDVLRSAMEREWKVTELSQIPVTVLV